MPLAQVTRAERFALHLTPSQEQELQRGVGAARWAFNHAHALTLAYQTAYDERVLAHVLRRADVDEVEQLHQAHTKPQRQKLFLEARRLVRQENQLRVAELKLIDEHRRRVTHKGKPALDPGPIPEGTSGMAKELYERRRYLAGLQQSNPTLYVQERKQELAKVRPRVLTAKRALAEAGAYQPTSFDVSAWWRQTRDKPADEGGSPWWTDLPTPLMFVCGFDRAERAWKNWSDSLSGKRSGPKMGMPRFKKKVTAPKTVSLPNPGRNLIACDGYRTLKVSGLGGIRLHKSAKRIARRIHKQQAEITSVTFRQEGHRWYASVLCTVTQDVPVLWRHQLPEGATNRDYPNGQRDYLNPFEAQAALTQLGGTVEQMGTPRRTVRAGLARASRKQSHELLAVDLGSQPLAVLSAPLDPADPSSGEIAAAKPLHAAAHRLTKAHRKFSRTKRGSKRRRKAAAAIAREHHLVAEQRATHLHHVSKLLATNTQAIAYETFDLTKLTASAKGTLESPGHNVALKSTFNRHLLDAGIGELRRQLSYKTRWYGSVQIPLDQGEPTATKCSRCGERNPSSTPGKQRFTCDACGLSVSRRTNAARSIYRAARTAVSAVTTLVAPGRGDTQNARGGRGTSSSETVPGPRPSKRPPPRRVEDLPHQGQATPARKGPAVRTQPQHPQRE